MSGVYVSSCRSEARAQRYQLAAQPDGLEGGCALAHQARHADVRQPHGRTNANGRRRRALDPGAAPRRQRDRQRRALLHQGHRERKNTRAARSSARRRPLGQPRWRDGATARTRPQQLLRQACRARKAQPLFHPVASSERPSRNRFRPQGPRAGQRPLGAHHPRSEGRSLIRHRPTPASANKTARAPCGGRHAIRRRRPNTVSSRTHRWHPRVAWPRGAASVVGGRGRARSRMAPQSIPPSRRDRHRAKPRQPSVPAGCAAAPSRKRHRVQSVRTPRRGAPHGDRRRPCRHPRTSAPKALAGASGPTRRAADKDAMGWRDPPVHADIVRPPCHRHGVRHSTAGLPGRSHPHPPARHQWRKGQHPGRHRAQRRRPGRGIEDSRKHNGTVAHRHIQGIPR